MDLGILGALLLLVGWGALTVFFGAPAWSNALLTVGVFLLVLRIAMRDTGKGHDGRGARTAGARQAAGRR